MRIVYNKNNGDITSGISSDQNPLRYYQYKSKEFRDNIAYIDIENVPYPLRDYYVIDGQIVEYSEIEKNEKRIYGKVLTDEERLLEQLKPTPGEIKKAETTIDILILLMEVI